VPRTQVSSRAPGLPGGAAAAHWEPMDQARAAHRSERSARTVLELNASQHGERTGTAAP